MELLATQAMEVMQVKVIVVQEMLALEAVAAVAVVNHPEVPPITEVEVSILMVKAAMVLEVQQTTQVVVVVLEVNLDNPELLVVNTEEELVELKMIHLLQELQVHKDL